MANDGGMMFPMTRVSYQVEGNFTIRDWFAGQALSAYLSSNEAIRQLGDALEEYVDKNKLERREAFRRVLARRAYLQADAMLAERQKGQGDGPTDP